MRFIADMREGDSVGDIYLVKQKRSLTTKNGKAYESLILQDRTGTIDAKIWDPGSPGIGEFDALDYVDIVGDVTSFQGNRQLNVKRARRCRDGEYDPANYVPSTEKDAKELYAQLIRYVNDVVKEPHLQRLLQLFFVEDQDFISIADGAYPLCNDYHGASLSLPAQRFPQCFVGLVVQS